MTKVELINPHTWIHVDVKNPVGTVVNWRFETRSPNVLLRRRGFTKNTIPVGTQVIIDGDQSKDGCCVPMDDVTLPNGQKLFLGSTGTGAPGLR